MIKAITMVQAIEQSDHFQALAELLGALGFEPGRGWETEEGKGLSFLAPVANLELVSGRMPATPELLIETTELDAVHGKVSGWAHSREMRVGEVAATHWGSRLFTAQLGDGLTVGFWQSENALHGRVEAVEGGVSSEGMRFGVITTRWNTVITDRLLQGALDCLFRSGTRRVDVTVVRVPGAWEIPNAARTLAESGSVDAIVALGCLLRGETAHYEAIYTEVARGIGQSQQETGLPHAFGVLTCETLEQALDRAGLKAGNKGFEAASAAVEMVHVLRRLKAGPASAKGGA